MKIALVSTPFVAVPPRDYGGTELVVYELAEGLVRRGHKVTVFATGDSRSSARLEHLYPRAVWPPTGLADTNHVTWALSAIAREGDYDVVHVHSAMALATARLLPPVPVVYTLHHPREESLSRFYEWFPDSWYVAISERQRELEMPLPRITTIYHGLNPRNYLGPTRAGDYVCFVGRLSEIKGPHIAIDVAERAGVEIRVGGSIHGDDRDPDWPRRELEPRLRLPHVRYLGSVGLAEKVPLLLNARALLMPLYWEEPFGLIMLEAMLAGCPPVAFPRGSAPELIEPGRTGFLVSGVEEMIDVVRNRLDGFDREQCRARAAQRFHRERMVAAYEAYYQQAMQETRTPSRLRTVASA
ncbi:MAG: glycosyltransferase family 4 protein [Gemmatimonadetes bacterium]|nr:glycosyltransferase family 4 protein [Gemmatimonadota bacterium]